MDPTEEKGGPVLTGPPRMNQATTARTRSGVAVDVVVAGVRDTGRSGGVGVAAGGLGGGILGGDVPGVDAHAVVVDVAGGVAVDVAARAAAGGEARVGRVRARPSVGRGRI